MRRVAITPRPNWQEQMENIGFKYHSIDGNYWQENAYYLFNEQQIDTLEAATKELHQMYLQAAAEIIKKGDYGRIGIDDFAAKIIEQSFDGQKASLYGRFDLCYDASGVPKLYEYNADTPTSLFEASVVQWYWLQGQYKELGNADQFNSIHEQLLLQFQSIKHHNSCQAMHFTAVSDSLEDYITTQYLQDVATQAGLQTYYLDIADIGYRSADMNFVDTDGQVIDQIFKLYPWEWLLSEEFGGHILDSQINFIEPAYKMLLSNKAMLAILWEMFPNHPNLLPASLQADSIANAVKKPFFSREGANITLKQGDLHLCTGGDYGKEGFVYQAYQPLPKFTNNQGQSVYAVIGSWIIGHSAAGIGIREDYSLITKDTSLFVPHVFF